MSTDYPPGSIRRALLACGLVAWAAASGAQTIDASSCRSAASSLESAASQLESAADDLEDAPARELRNAEAEVRDLAQRAVSKAQSVAGSCGARDGYAMSERAVVAILANLLEVRFGSSPEVTARIQALRPELEFVARSHIIARPTDFRQSAALAELLYQHSMQAPSDAVKR